MKNTINAKMIVSSIKVILNITFKISNYWFNIALIKNKNIVINSQKYIRTVLSDDCKCECITNNGQRCTLKKSKDSKYCSRHISKMS